MTVIFELITAILCLAVGVVFIVSSLMLGQESDFPFLEGPAVFPLIFAGIVSVLALIMLLQVVVRKRVELGEAFRNIKPAFAANKNDILKLAIIVAVTFIYIAVLMPWVGFTISTFAYLTVCTLYFGKLKPWLAVLVSGAFSVGVYYFFMNILSIYLP